MIFNLLRSRCNDADDTGTYADGAFEPAAIEIKSVPRRLRGHIAHQRDYGSDRVVAPLPTGLA